VNGEPLDGNAVVRALLEELFTGLPDLCIERGTVHHADGAVIAEGWMSGTHLGPFNGIPATGRAVRYPIVAIFEFDGDRLVCEKVYFDSAQLLSQIGALPS
jgi:steroid delta-isomerase-like uncharacterized protein